MPCWYYDKKELRVTPSIQDGIDYETECRYRREGARFIIDTGTKMGLRYDTMATGVVYFHRFYMFHSFKEFPRYVTACCCLFLAGKVEETPKKCKDIIRTARALLTDQKFAQFGEDPKEDVMTQERILLQTIKFDLQVEHPYSFLIKYAKSLKGDKVKLQKMVQMAWTFVNDSLCTTLSLQWEPEVIAIALMYLAGKLSKFEVIDWTGRHPKHLRWWDMFVEDISLDLLEDICHQVLDLYSQPQSQRTDSPPPSAVSGSSATPISVVINKVSRPASPVTVGTPAKVMKAEGKRPDFMEPSVDVKSQKSEVATASQPYQYNYHAPSGYAPPTYPPNFPSVTTHPPTAHHSSTSHPLPTGHPNTSHTTPTGHPPPTGHPNTSHPPPTGHPNTSHSLPTGHPNTSHPPHTGHPNTSHPPPSGHPNTNHPPPATHQNTNHPPSTGLSSTGHPTSTTLPSNTAPTATQSIPSASIPPNNSVPPHTQYTPYHHYQQGPPPTTQAPPSQYYPPPASSQPGSASYNNPYPPPTSQSRPYFPPPTL